MANAIPRGWLALAVAVPFLTLQPAWANTDAAARMAGEGRQAIADGKLKTALIELKRAAKEDPQDPQIRFDLATVDLRLGDYESAQLEFQAARDRGFDLARVQPLIAWTMYYQGQFDKLLKSNLSCPEGAAGCQAELLAIRARAELQLKDLKAAEADSRAAIAAQPENLTAADTRALVLISTGDIAHAEELTDKSLALDPRRPDALALKGELRRRAGDTQAAIGLFRQAIEVAPRYLYPRIQLAMMLIESNQLDEAKREVADAVATAPNSVAALYLKAVYQTRTNDMAGAQETLRPVEIEVASLPRGLFLLGLINLNTNNLESALHYATRFHTEVPDNLTGTKLLANIALLLRDFDKVLALLEPLRDQISNDGESLDILGTAYLAEGRGREASEVLGRAVALRPEDNTARSGLALLRAGQRETREAGIHELEDLVAKPGTNAKLGLALISTLYGSGEYSRAIKAASDMIARDPAQPLGYSLRGLARDASGDEAGARKDFETALAKDPRFVPAAVSLANDDLRRNDVGHARNLLDQILAQVPGDYQALMARVRIEDRAENRPAMIPFLERAITAAPEAIEPRALLLGLLVTSDPAKAAIRAGDLARSQPRNPAAMDLAARTLIGLGKADEAAALMTGLERDFPTDVGVHLRAGDVFRSMKRYPDAARAYDRAIAANSAAIPAWYGRVMVEMDTRGLAAAQEMAAKLRAANPRDPIAWLVGGELYERNGRLAEAIEIYRRAQAEAPAPVVTNRLFGAMVAKGERTQARAMLRDWLAHHPEDIGNALALGDDLLAAGEFRAAVTQYEGLKTLAPRNPLLFNNLANAYDALDAPEAMATAKYAYSLAPGTAAIADTYGDLLVRRGDPRQGVPLLKLAARALPGDPTVAFHYARGLAMVHADAEAREVLKPLTASGTRFPDAEAARQLYARLGGK